MFKLEEAFPPTNLGGSGKVLVYRFYGLFCFRAVHDGCFFGNFRQSQVTTSKRTAFEVSDTVMSESLDRFLVLPSSLRNWF